MYFSNYSFVPFILCYLHGEMKKILSLVVWYTNTEQEICNKIVIKDPTTLQTCRYITLQDISFQKLHQQPKAARQRQTKRTPTLRIM